MPSWTPARYDFTDKTPEGGQDDSQYQGGAWERSVVVKDVNDAPVNFVTEGFDSAQPDFTQLDEQGGSADTCPVPNAAWDTANGGAAAGAILLTATASTLAAATHFEGSHNLRVTRNSDDAPFVVGYGFWRLNPRYGATG